MSLDVFGLVLLAAEEISHEWVPPWDWRAQIALPAGFLIFFGSIFLLLRSNLGTRRAYLVEATAFFSFMIVLALFWAFGAPGTPIATGPITLPGQQLDTYQPQWVPFAQDSRIAEDPRYSDVAVFPEGWAPVTEELAAQVDSGLQEIQTFFANPEGGQRIGGHWIVDPDIVRYREAGNGFLMVGAVFRDTYQPDDEGNPPEGVSENQLDQPIPDGASFQAFAFFDPGAIQFPSFVMLGIMIVGFVVHLALLALDERRERREAEQAVALDEPEKVPAGA